MKLRGKRRASPLRRSTRAVAAKPKMPRMWVARKPESAGPEFLEGRIIAGKRILYKEELYPERVFGQLGAFGSHGTLNFIIYSSTDAKNAKDALVKKASDCGSHGKMIGQLTRISGKVMQVMREVPPKHQAKGIGTALLREAEKVASAHGVSLIYARTENLNAVKSYERCGWQPIWQEQYKPKLMCYGKFLK